ncbi:MAG: ABC transporter ATP-binding protein [Acidimicrobiaceae bacterium]|nr:ABC transporter ATP-binding protein [Acidimicrobiaceae bacterium]
MALLGESGAGKSVTARAIVRVLDETRFVTSGSLRLGETEVLALRGKALQQHRGRVALVFQDPSRTLNPSMRVGQQIVEGVLAARELDARAARERAVALMRDVGIADPEDRFYNYPHQLSGGMKQRIVIAIALALEPELLVADEPTTSLDVTTQAQIMDLISRLVEERGMALLLITHDVALAASYVDEIAVMYAGQVVETGPAEEIATDPKMPYTKALISAIPGMEGTGLPRAIRGRPPDLWSLPTGCAFHPRCSEAMERCSEAAPTLIEIGPRRQAACWLTEAAR